MGKINAFTFITLDGYFKGPNEDISWHRHGREESEYSAKSLKAGSTLLFGRKTYQMMASFWPTPMAYENFPDVAEGMNTAEKIVFTNTLKNADWRNTQVVGGDIVEAARKLKADGKTMTLLGSGSILTQLTTAGLIDEYEIMVNPVAIGDGTAIFKDLMHQLDLTLIDSKVFQNGTVLLYYRPAQKQTQ